MFSAEFAAGFFKPSYPAINPAYGFLTWSAAACPAPSTCCCAAAAAAVVVVAVVVLRRRRWQRRWRWLQPKRTTLPQVEHRRRSLEPWRALLRPSLVSAPQSMQQTRTVLQHDGPNRLGLWAQRGHAGHLCQEPGAGTHGGQYCAQCCQPRVGKVGAPQSMQQLWTVLRRRWPESPRVLVNQVVAGAMCNTSSTTLNEAVAKTTITPGAPRGDDCLHRVYAANMDCPPT